jgi:hypothetical protein
LSRRNPAGCERSPLQVLNPIPLFVTLPVGFPARKAKYKDHAFGSCSIERSV